MFSNPEVQGALGVTALLAFVGGIVWLTNRSIDDWYSTRRTREYVVKDTKEFVLTQKEREWINTRTGRRRWRKVGIPHLIMKP